MSELQESITEHTERARGLIRLAHRAMSANLALGENSDADVVAALHAADDILGRALTALDDFEAAGCEKSAAPDEDDAFDPEIGENEPIAVWVARQHARFIADVVCAVRAQGGNLVIPSESTLSYNWWAERLFRAARSTLSKPDDNPFLPWDTYKSASNLLERLALDLLGPVSEVALNYQMRCVKLGANHGFEERYIAGIGFDHFPASGAELFEDLLGKTAAERKAGAA